jgi:hypothetical protein
MRRAAVWIAVGALAVAGCGGGKGPKRKPVSEALSIPWRLESPASARDRVLRVRYTYPGTICDYRFQRVSAQETADAVTVAVHARFAPRRDMACVAIVGGGRVSVRLRAPLDGRRLLHAPVSRRPR